MAKYTLTYDRKVQVRQYESLSIGLSYEFDDQLTGRAEAFGYVSDTVNEWIAKERVKL